jgi:hypothetical protein
MATHHQQRYPGGNGHDGRDAREIQNDIERTRSEMDHTIDELSERLNPRHLMDMAYDYFRSNTTVSRSDLSHGAKRVGKSVGKTVLREIEEHPIPAMLIGAGLLYALFVEDDETPKRDFHSQWGDIPEYSGSFVDARTGEPYDLETYGAEWKQEACAWHPAYDWSRSDVNEQSWTDRARQSLDSVKSALGDTGRTARDKMRHAASSVLNLSGHKRRAAHSRWANLRSHGGEWVDVHSGQRYDPSHARDWESVMACDYAATSDWSAEDEATWTEKAQHALEEMQQSLADSGRSVKEQVQAIASKIGEFVGSSRDVSADFGRSMYDRAGRAGSSIREGASWAGSGIRQGAGQAGRGMGRGARYLTRQTRRGGAAMQQQLQQGYAYSRDAAAQTMDDYPLAAGAAFLGIGLLLGFALPSTPYEDRMMGERSDELKHQAKETGREAAERARHIAQATAAAALDEAEHQGLTPQQLGEKVQHAAEGLKQTVAEASPAAGLSSVADKVTAVAERVVATAKEEVKKEAQDMTS